MLTKTELNENGGKQKRIFVEYQHRRNLNTLTTTSLASLVFTKDNQVSF